MQLTLHTDYALRVLVYLSINQHKLVTINELANFFDISKNHLVKIVHKLGVKGFVQTVRGKGGGVRLAYPPQAINIGTVVREIEGNFQIAECFNRKKQGTCRIQPLCGLGGLFTSAVEQFMAVLDDTLLSDIVLQPQHIAERNNVSAETAGL